MSRVYLDHAASSPLRPAARAAMVAALDVFGNASSVHREGQAARAVLDEARRQVAELVGAHAGAVVLTSGGTEANNMALRGMMGKVSGKRLLVSALEHDCVYRTAQALWAQGVGGEPIPATPAGGVDMAWLETELAKGDVGVVSVMMANNETGAVMPVAAMARLAKAHGVLFHTDAVQAVGHMPLAMESLGVDAMTVSSHKLGGPKGAGGLIVRGDVAMDALLTGGSQERNRRAGTEDVLAIAGFGAACAALKESLEAEFEHMMRLRRVVLDGVRALGIEIVAETAPKVPHIVQLRVSGKKGEDLVMALDMRGVAVSQGSACSSGRVEPSRVLQAMGYGPTEAGEGLRISWGWSTTEGEIKTFLGALKEVL